MIKVKLTKERIQSILSAEHRAWLLFFMMNQGNEMVPVRHDGKKQVRRASEVLDEKTRVTGHFQFLFVYEALYFHPFVAFLISTT